MYDKGKEDSDCTCVAEIKMEADKYIIMTIKRELGILSWLKNKLRSNDK